MSSCIFFVGDDGADSGSGGFGSPVGKRKRNTADSGRADSCAWPREPMQERALPVPPVEWHGDALALLSLTLGAAPIALLPPVRSQEHRGDQAVKLEPPAFGAPIGEFDEAA